MHFHDADKMRIISACGRVSDGVPMMRARELHEPFVMEREDHEDVRRPRADDRQCYGIIQVDCE